jgi:hypothetical protein
MSSLMKFFYFYLSIAQVSMAAAVAFQQALLRLGFNQDSSAALNANGLTMTEDLIDLE